MIGYTAFWLYIYLNIRSAYLSMIYWPVIWPGLFLHSLFSLFLFPSLCLSLWLCFSLTPFLSFFVPLCLSLFVPEDAFKHYTIVRNCSSTHVDFCCLGKDKLKHNCREGLVAVMPYVTSKSMLMVPYPSLPALFPVKITQLYSGNWKSCFDHQYFSFGLNTHAVSRWPLRTPLFQQI